MSTEHLDLRTLRMALGTAIAAAIAAEEAIRAARTPADVVEMHFARNLAQADERWAARAFFAELQAVDPACSSCGCTMCDPCEPPCWWAQASPALCSTCARKEQQP